MKYLKVDKQTITNALKEFLGDVGYRNCKSFVGLKKFLRRRKWKLKTEETKDLIYFTITNKRNNQPKYYSCPLIKFEPDYDKETKVFISVDGPVGIMDIYESDMPVYNYNKMRENFKPKQEEVRRHREWKNEFLQSRKNHSLNKYDFIHNQQEEIDHEIWQKKNKSKFKYAMYKDNYFYWLEEKRDRKTHKLNIFYKSEKTALPTNKILKAIKSSEFLKWSEYKGYLIFIEDYSRMGYPMGRYMQILDPEDGITEIEIILTHSEDPAEMVEVFLKEGIIDFNVIQERYNLSIVSIQNLKWELSCVNIIEKQEDEESIDSDKCSKYPILKNHSEKEIRDTIIQRIEIYRMEG